MMVMQKRSKVIHSSGTVTSTIYLSASLISCIPAQYILLLYLALDDEEDDGGDDDDDDEWDD